MILRFCTYNIGMAKKTEVHTKLTFAEILEDAIKILDITMQRSQVCWAFPEELYPTG